jgi:hypothetical protein
MSFKLNWYAFLIAFAVGITYVYFVVPPPKIVLKYPNPYNVDKVIYQDESKACYKYSADKIDCPKNEKDITIQPVNTM